MLMAISAIALIMVGISPHTAANEKTVVTVHIDGERQVVTTDAQTVGDVIERAGIELHQADIVEPKVDAEITNHSFNVNIYRSRPVVLVDGDEVHRVKTAHQSPRLIAEKAEELEVYEEDRLEPELVSDFLNSDHIGHRITIQRATSVNMKIADKVTKIRTHADTVGEMFAEAGIEIGDDDIVRPDLTTPITEDMEIFLTQIGFETITVEEAIEPDTETIYDNNRPVGYREVEDDGTAGMALVTYRIEYRNGEEIKRTEVRKIVEKEPKPRRVVVGNRTNYDYAPGEIRNAIVNWANHYNVSANTLLRVAECESTFNPGATGPDLTHLGIFERPKGLFQFLPSTFAANAPGAGLTKPDIWSVDHQSRTAAYMFSIGQAGQWSCY